MRKILVLSANPKNTNKLRLDEEFREIDEGLKRSNHRDQFDLTSKWAVRERDFYRTILEVKPQIVHFSGHGGGEEGIVLEDERGDVLFLATEQIAGLFKLFATKGLECVVLNASFSEVQAKKISEYVPYVIGMKQAIGDKAAIAFAVAFYDALGAGETVEFAYELGCAVLVKLKENQTPVFKKNPELKANVLDRKVIDEVTGQDSEVVGFDRISRSKQLIRNKAVANKLTYLVDRPKERNQLVARLLNSQDETPKLIALWGQGGCGKTALALAVCCESEVLEYFTGGVFWVSLGKGIDVIDGIKVLYEQSTGLRPLSNTVENLSIEFSNKWSDKPRLIVLDNLQTLEELVQFFLCSNDNDNCTWLITTRDNRSFASADLLNLTKIVIQIDNLGVAESTLILCCELQERYKIDADKLSSLFNNLQNLVAQLYEFPLLINLIRTEIREAIFNVEADYETVYAALEDLIDQIQQTGWEFYMDKLSETFRTSFECLTDVEMKALEELVIFPEHQNIPISVLGRLWNLDKAHTKKRCALFFSLSLLRRYDRGKTVRVNNILRQYFLEMEEIRENRSKIHWKLLKSYEKAYQIPSNISNMTEAEVVAIISDLAYTDDEERKYVKGFYQYHLDRVKCSSS